MDAVWEAIQNAWNAIIDATTKVVTPDWGALVALIPVGLAVLVVVFLVWIVIRYASAGPTRRGPARVAPRAPEGVHMPGPSFAPVFAAVGAFLFLFGMVLGAGSVPFWLGIAALVLTLLYWLREGMRDYDRIDHPGTLPVPAYGGPPAGIHMPGPSFRPILVSIAAAVFVFGLVVGPALIVAGILMLFIALVGWLRDAGSEYHAVAEADETRHVASQPVPRYPVGTLVTFVLILIVAVSITVGVIPPTSVEGGTGPAASGSPASGGSPALGGSPAPGGSAPAGSPAATADVTITARNIAYDVTEVTVPAGRPFTIAFVNNDAGVPHNVAIHQDSPTGPEVWKGEIFNGVETRNYQVPALAAGTYGFACSVHPNMTGTLTAR